MIDPKYTTLYNHEKPGELPVIPNKVYKELLEAIDRGEVENLESIKQEYSLTTEQETLAISKLNKTA